MKNHKYDYNDYRMRVGRYRVLFDTKEQVRIIAIQKVKKRDSLIRAWREHLGMTQDELAAKAGIKQPALARMEKPDASPRNSSLAKLADAMEITVDQLIE